MHLIEQGGGHEGSCKRNNTEKPKWRVNGAVLVTVKPKQGLLLRGSSVISPLCDASIHAANIRVPHCNGVMKRCLYDR